MFLRTLLLTCSATLFAVTAFAQSSPAPADAHAHAGHDHSKMESTQTQVEDQLPGTFTELAGEHAIGNSNAPVTLIIYASVTCPHCAHWFTSTWSDLKANYIDKGKVRVVFREFPTAPAQLAVAGFQIANCAPEEEYFPIIEHLMTEQENIIEAVKGGKGLETFLAIAKMAGVNSEADMNACFDSQSGYGKINRSMDLAKSGNIQSVPNFIINGAQYTESADYLPLSKHLESLLGQGFSPIPKR